MACQNPEELSIIFSNNIKNSEDLCWDKIEKTIGKAKDWADEEISNAVIILDKASKGCENDKNSLIRTKAVEYLGSVCSANSKNFSVKISET